MVKKQVSKPTEQVISAQDIISAHKTKTAGNSNINLAKFASYTKINQKNYMYKVAKQLLEMDKKD